MQCFLPLSSDWRGKTKKRLTGVDINSKSQTFFLICLADYQAKSNTMSRGMPAPFTFSMSAARASRMLAFSAAYC